MYSMVPPAAGVSDYKCISPNAITGRAVLSSRFFIVLKYCISIYLVVFQNTTRTSLKFANFSSIRRVPAQFQVVAIVTGARFRL